MREALEQIARIAADAGMRYVSFSVNNEVTVVIAAMPGAKKRATVYVAEKTPPYVIEAAEVVVHGVELSAQTKARPATQEELEPEEGWAEHNEPFSARRL